MKAGCWLGKINGVQEQEIDPMIVSTNMLNMMKDDVGTIDVKGSRCTNVPMYLLRCFVENTLHNDEDFVFDCFLQPVLWHCYRRLST